jgi:hypothetical protein
MNKAYKCATQEKYHSSTKAGYIKKAIAFKLERTG